MTGGRWQRIEALFESMADLPVSEQSVRLEAECAGDSDLLDEVKRLLARDRSHSGRIAQVIAGVAAIPPAEPARFEGRRLGPYRVIREVGRGGMGVVFEAIRDDHEFHKRVALKVAASAAYAPEFLQRFRHERQILAQLEHPHIARLLDGGTTDEGVPFFAMEFVEGQPIHEYAAAHRLSVAERARLFLQVCDAVEYAHQNLVIHRDLKPRNILVDDGSVRLLDFGIAKLVDAVDAGQTMAGSAPMTPEYCSPEQLSRQPITTRTDVYLLGLVLYELLSGERAQSPDTSSPRTLERSICEAEIVPPSARALARGETALARQIRGDLDTIVLTAMHKEPARRYASVAALADDLRSYLEVKPIRARQDSRWYLTRRFVRRHWMPLTASALIAATLVAGIVATAYQARRAERRFQQVRGIANALMVDVHDAIRDLPASTRAQEVVVRTAVEYLDSLAQEAGGDRVLATEIAQGYMKVAQLAYGINRPSLGRPEEARRYYDKAKAIIDELRRTSHDDAAVSAAAATLSTRTGEFLLDTGQPREAFQSLQEAVRIAEAGLGNDASNVALLIASMEAHSTLVRSFVGHPDVRQYVPRYVEVAERIAGLRPVAAESLAELGVAYSQAGKQAASDGALEQALDFYRKNVDLQTRAVALEPDSATARRNLMMAWSTVADVALGPLGTNSYTGASLLVEDIGADRRRDALEAAHKAVEQAQWIYSRDPANDTSRFDYAISLGREAPAFPQGDLRAIAAVETSLAMLHVLEATHPSRTLGFLLEFHGSLAERRRQAGQIELAIAEWRTVDAMVRAAVAKDPEGYYPRRMAIPAFVNWALTLAAAHDAAGAREIASRVRRLAAEVAEQEAHYERAPGWPPRVEAWLAGVYDLLGHSPAARAAREESLRMWKAVAARPRLPPDLLNEARAAIEDAGKAAQR